jgi:hypothetical protein
MTDPNEAELTPPTDAGTPPIASASQAFLWGAPSTQQPEAWSVAVPAIAVGDAAPAAAEDGAAQEEGSMMDATGSGDGSSSFEEVDVPGFDLPEPAADGVIDVPGFDGGAAEAQADQVEPAAASTPDPLVLPLAPADDDEVTTPDMVAPAVAATAASPAWGGVPTPPAAPPVAPPPPTPGAPAGEIPGWGSQLAAAPTPPTPPAPAAAVPPPPPAAQAPMLPAMPPTPTAPAPLVPPAPLANVVSEWGKPVQHGVIPGWGAAPEPAAPPQPAPVAPMPPPAPPAVPPAPAAAEIPGWGAAPEPVAPPAPPAPPEPVAPTPPPAPPGWGAAPEPAAPPAPPAPPEPAPAPAPVPEAPPSPPSPVRPATPAEVPVGVAPRGPTGGKRCEVCGREFGGLWRIVVQTPGGFEEHFVCGDPATCAVPSLVPPVQA